MRSRVQTVDRHVTQSSAKSLGFIRIAIKLNSLSELRGRRALLVIASFFQAISLLEPAANATPIAITVVISMFSVSFIS